MRHFEVKRNTQISDMLGDIEIGLSIYSDMSREEIDQIVMDAIGNLINFQHFALEYEDCIDINDEHNLFRYNGKKYDFVIENRALEGHFKGVLYELGDKFELIEVIEDDMPF